MSHSVVEPIDCFISKYISAYLCHGHRLAREIGTIARGLTFLACGANSFINSAIVASTGRYRFRKYKIVPNEGLRIQNSSRSMPIVMQISYKSRTVNFLLHSAREQKYILENLPEGTSRNTVDALLDVSSVQQMSNGKDKWIYILRYC